MCTTLHCPKSLVRAEACSFNTLACSRSIPYMELVEMLPYTKISATEIQTFLSIHWTSISPKTLPKEALFVCISTAEASPSFKDSHRWRHSISRDKIYGLQQLSTAKLLPVAVQDALLAEWVQKNAEKYGADTSQWVISGESAGGNLTLGITLASCFELGESWTQRIFDLNLPIKAIMPICGFLQVSNPERYTKRKKLSRFIKSRMTAISKRYLQGKASSGGSNFSS